VIEPVLSDDEFIEDFARAPMSQSQVHLWWLGQSGFLVRWESWSILVDPYLSDSLTAKYANTEKPHVRMTRRVVDPYDLFGRISVITSSHAHTDHLDAETVRPLREEGRFPLFVAPRAISKIVEERWGPADYWADDGEPINIGNTLFVDPIAAAHDAIERDAQGNCRCLGYVFTFGQTRVYHSGDTVIYEGMVERLKPFNVDLALLPINGKVGNMNGADAARLAHDIGAKLVVPCHYEMFEFNTASPYELFVPECERLGQPYKVLQAGERLTLTK
jgi:L-ascorbate metabolism protein UlaG (beta-lactamase superfamily)